MYLNIKSNISKCLCMPFTSYADWHCTLLYYYLGRVTDHVTGSDLTQLWAILVYLRSLYYLFPGLGRAVMEQSLSHEDPLIAVLLAGWVAKLCLWPVRA